MAHRQLPEVPVRRDITIPRRLLQVVGPLRGHEVRRCAFGDLPGPVRVQLLQDRHGLHERFGARAAGELDGLQHVRGELRQVGIGVVEHCQMPLVTRQPASRLGNGGPQPLHADGVPQQPTDHLVLDPGVHQDRQDLVQQGLPSLPRRGADGAGGLQRDLRRFQRNHSRSAISVVFAADDTATPSRGLVCAAHAICREPGARAVRPTGGGGGGSTAPRSGGGAQRPSAGLDSLDVIGVTGLTGGIGVIGASPTARRGGARNGPFGCAAGRAASSADSILDAV